MTLNGFLPLSGVVTVVLALLAFIVGGSSPDVDASGSKVASFYDSHRGRQHAAAFLLIWATPFLVMFGVALLVRPRRTGAAAEWWTRLAFAGTVVAAVGFLVTAATTIALTDGADKSIGGQALQALNALSNDSWAIFVPGLGMMFLGACVPLLSERTWLRWLGWLGLILGIVSFVPFIAFFGFIGSTIWILLVSIGLYMTSAAHQSLPAAAET